MTFDINRGSSNESSQLDCSAVNGMPNSNNAGGDPGATAFATAHSSSSVSSKSGSSATTRRRSRLREKFPKKLRGGLLSKKPLRSEKAKSDAAAAAAAVEVNIDEQKVDFTNQSPAEPTGMHRKSDLEAAGAISADSRSETTTAQQISSIMHNNDSESLNSLLQVIQSLPTSHTGITGGGSEVSDEESLVEPASRRFKDDDQQHSYYIGDIAKSLSTYYADGGGGPGEISDEESCVETVLSQYTHEELKGIYLNRDLLSERGGGGDCINARTLASDRSSSVAGGYSFTCAVGGVGDDNATAASSVKSSLVGYNFL